MTQVIYKIVNLVNDKFYVGSTIHKKVRFRQHRKLLRGNRHHCKHLQAAWNKYGEAKFDFVVVEEVPDNLSLQEAEDRWLKVNVGQPHCYNTGYSSDTPWRGAPAHKTPNFGRPVSEDQRQKISASLKEFYAEDYFNHPRVGKAHTEETKAKISAKVRQAAAEGRAGAFIPSEETRKKMSEALKGNQNARKYKRTEEECEGIRQRMLGNQNWLGRKHTEESKEKMRKKVREETSGQVFGSLTEVLAHYGMQMPTLQRALNSGKPISKGKFLGLRFVYA